MSKFDRGVFIFIGLGIWVLAMSQIFAPKIADAGLSAIPVSYTNLTLPTNREV